jgi:hypothetical protein
VVNTEPDEYAVWETVQKDFKAEEFRCPSCDLRLDAADFEVAELEGEYSSEEQREMEYEPDYGND